VLLNRLDTKNYFRKKKGLEEKEKLERKLREEEERKRREEEKEKQREREQKEFDGGEEEMDKKYRGETAVASNTGAASDNLQRSSAVVSGAQAAARKKKSLVGISGSDKATLSEITDAGSGDLASNNGHLLNRGNGRKSSEPPQNEGHSGSVGRGRDTDRRPDDEFRGPKGHYENDPIAINYFNSVEDSSRTYHKPLTETFEPVSIGLKRPQRRLMKIRSIPLSDSDEIMVVSAEPSGDLQPQVISHGFPSNGYETSELPMVLNGHGLGGLDDVMVINGGPLPAIKSFTDGNHLLNKIVLNNVDDDDDDDDDYDNTVSPAEGDVVEEIYDDTISVMSQSKGWVNGLIPASSVDNTYDEVNSMDMDAEKAPSLSPENYSEPVALKQRTSEPDFHQSPGRYTDPASIMAQPPIPLTPEEKSPLECSSDRLEPCSVTAKDRGEVNGRRRLSPVQSLGETSCTSEELYENLHNIKLEKSSLLEPTNHKINQNSPLRMSYFTGISPLDDEDYGDTPSIPPSSRKHPKSPILPRPPKTQIAHQRNPSLDGDVFLPGSQPPPQSRTCHNANFHRRLGTKAKKSQSSSGDPVTVESPVFPQSPVVGVLQVGAEAKAKSPGGSPKRQARKGMKKSVSGSQDSLDDDVANEVPKFPRSPKKLGRKEITRSKSEPEEVIHEAFQNKSNAKSPGSPKKHARKQMKKSQSESGEVKAKSPNFLKKRAQNKQKSIDSTPLLFSPHAPLPPIPSGSVPLEVPRLEPSPYCVPGEILKSDSVDSRTSTVYDYIGSNTLEKVINEASSTASPYLQFQPRKISPTGTPQPYTQPIERKNKKHMKLSRSVNLIDPPPLPARSPVPAHRTQSHPEQNIDSRPPALPPVVLTDKRPPALPPVVLTDKRPPALPPVVLTDKRPPALPPVVLTDKRPPAPLPPEAMGPNSTSQHQHQPLSYSKSLQTQENSSPIRTKGRQHAQLSRNVSAAVLSSAPECKSGSSAKTDELSKRLCGHISGNKSPLIPRRFPLNHAPPPATPTSATPISSQITGNQSRCHAPVNETDAVGKTQCEQNESGEQVPHVKDSPLTPKTKLKATSTHSDQVKPSPKPRSSTSVSMESATTLQTSSSDSPGDNSMPQWKRALLEKKQQQQLQKQQHVVCGRKTN